MKVRNVLWPFCSNHNPCKDATVCNRTVHNKKVNVYPAAYLRAQNGRFLNEFAEDPKAPLNGSRTADEEQL
jgi:hypothetical protein